MQVSAQPPVLTPRAVADLFSVSVDTVNRWADEGLLPGFKTPSGRWRFYQGDVDAFLNTQPTREAS